MNPKDLLRYLSKPAKYALLLLPLFFAFVTNRLSLSCQTSLTRLRTHSCDSRLPALSQFLPSSPPQSRYLSSARPDTLIGIGIFQHEGTED